MFEATRDFFNDALNFSLSTQSMLDIVLVLTEQDDPIPLGQAIQTLCQMTPRERNYICCVLLERDQDPTAWGQFWLSLESEAFE